MPLLTPEQLEKLRQIIRDASTAVAISTTGMEVSDEQLQRLADSGYVDPGELHNVVLDSFELGRIMAATPDAKEWSYQKLANHLARMPVELSDQEQRAVSHLQARAGQFCVGLGTRAEGNLTLAAADMDQQLAEAFQYGIQNEAAQALARRETVGRLTTRLRQMSQDWARDWGRIASTESQMAHQMGFIESTAEQYGTGEKVAKIPEPSACDDCLRLYLVDGKPRAEPIEWWQGNGVANYGLKRAEWKPVMGAMHPWCQCALVRVPEGWGFSDDWDIVPLDDEDGEAEKGHRPTLTVQTLRKSRKLHGKMRWRGLEISIENRKGSVRKWYDRSTQTEGHTRMLWPYGYFNLTEGADGDHVDCFVGPEPETATHVYVVHQMLAPHFDEYDEDKVMVGWPTAKAAKRAYLSHFDQPGFFGAMDAIPVERFVRKVKERKLADGKRIRKASSGQFRGNNGYVGHNRPVGTMGNVGKPARTPGENTFAAQAPTDHPYGPDAREKKRKKKRKKQDRSQQKRSIAVGPVAYTDGYVRDKPKVEFDVEQDIEGRRKRIEQQQDARAKRLDGMRLTVRPQDMRP